MALAIARKEDDLDVTDTSPKIRIGGLPKRSVDLELFDSLHPGHLVKTAASDYSDRRSRHLCLDVYIRQVLRRAALNLPVFLSPPIDVQRKAGRTRRRYRVPCSRELSRSSYPYEEWLE